jgi:hypothetical protein
LHLLARLLSRPPHRFAGLSGAPFGRLLVSAAPLQFTEESFTLKSALQDLEGLIDIVVANQNLQGMSFRCSLICRVTRPSAVSPAPVRREKKLQSGGLQVDSRRVNAFRRRDRRTGCYPSSAMS